MSRRWVGWFSLVALAGGAITACGGQSERVGDGSASGGESGDGGTQGGRGGTGGSSGTVGNAGNGGASTNPFICVEPVDSGPCEAAIRRYAYDPNTDLCVPFVYGGCQGNANNFESAEACYGTCRLSEVDPWACERPADCVLVPTTCCGACDPPTIWNVVAVGSGHASAVQMGMGCGAVDCPPCDAPARNPTLFATCTAGHCIAVDALETELTECTQARDCILRAGLECCEACNAAPSDIVAVSGWTDLEPWLCGGAPDECDACTSAKPNFLGPTCRNMRCQVEAVSPPVD